jgi:uncharacterized membrane protein YdfJ with MMPL/SSD domain
MILPPLFPSLAEVTQKQPLSPLPAIAPAMVANQQMAEVFPESGSDNVLLVLLTNEKGLGQADEQVYRTLVDRLRLDSQDVEMVQDFVSTAPLRDTLSSEDGNAWILPIGLSGELGSEESNAAYNLRAAYVPVSSAPWARPAVSTFLVRTVTVPAMAVLVGRANWWPSQWRPRPPPPAKRAEQVPAPDAG